MPSVGYVPKGKAAGYKTLQMIVHDSSISAVDDKAERFDDPNAGYNDYIARYFVCMRS